MEQSLKINLSKHFADAGSDGLPVFWERVSQDILDNTGTETFRVLFSPKDFLEMATPYLQANGIINDLPSKDKTILLVFAGNWVNNYEMDRVQRADGKKILSPSWNWRVEVIPKEEESFLSIFRKVYNWEPMNFPPFSGTRIMMMPVRLGALDGVPENYWRFMELLYGMVEERHHGEIGYLTIDERELQPGETLRRAGLHVDGYYHGNAGAWGGGNGPGGGWGSVGNGMLTVSSTPHCRGYLGMIYGKPGDEGEADHLVLPNEGTLFEANEVYWVDGACIHESLPVEEPTKRQFVRLSLPNNGPWFEGYTPNPTGIQPTGQILPRRDKLMK